MYYAERWIDGLLHYKTTPDGEWRPFSIRMYANRIEEREKEIMCLKYEQEKQEKQDTQNGLYGACTWALEQFERLAQDGRYPEFMLTVNGGEGFMPLLNAIEEYKSCV